MAGLLLFGDVVDSGSSGFGKETPFPAASVDACVSAVFLPYPKTPEMAEAMLLKAPGVVEPVFSPSILRFFGVAAVSAS